MLPFLQDVSMRPSLGYLTSMTWPMTKRDKAVRDSKTKLNHKNTKHARLMVSQKQATCSCTIFSSFLGCLTRSPGLLSGKCDCGVVQFACGVQAPLLPPSSNANPMLFQIQSLYTNGLDEIGQSEISSNHRAPTMQ